MIVLRILLYILLGIVLFVGLLLSLRLKLSIRLTDRLVLRAGLGPVVLTIVPAKKKKPVKLKDFTYEKHQKRLQKERAQKAKKAEKSKKKKQPKAVVKQAQVTAKKEKAAEKTGTEAKKFTLELILEILGFILEEFPRFTSSIHTEIRMLDITVAGKDAADCAVKYGVISQLASYLIELLDNGTALTPITPDTVAVRADFTAAKSVYRLDIRIQLRLFAVARVGVRTLICLLKSRFKDN